MNKKRKINSFRKLLRWQCLLSLLIVFLGGISTTKASHVRAGEVSYRVVAPYTIKATIFTYTKIEGANPGADEPQLNIMWGDGTTSTAPRTNGSGNGVNIGNNVKKNVYEATHVYAGAPPAPNNFYVISVADSLRNNAIDNINNGVSDGVIFYVEDTIFFRDDIANIGFNSSPVLYNPPIDFAMVGDTFYHNPLAIDPDGDSLVYELKIPLQMRGTVVPGYKYPHETHIDVNPQLPAYEEIDRQNGTYMWAVPRQPGIYNIAIIIREYRRGILMGTMIRDMQIFVEPGQNHPPQIEPLKDTCVRAGDVLRQTIIATDPDVGQQITLSGNGAPMLLAESPAEFPTVTGLSPVSSLFQWQTLCSHIQRVFYQVVFKAQDNYTIPLVDHESWLIDVIPPPVENVTASALHQTITVNWNNYDCGSFDNFRGFSVWRRLGSNPFEPTYCETGLEGRGYTKIADKVFDTQYVDNTAIRGHEYCYRILARFSKKSPNGIYEWDDIESVPSNEACVYLPLNIPVITKVSVSATDVSAGVMDIAWTKPIADSTNLDTIIDPPPYRFELYRSQGFSVASPQFVYGITRNSYHELNDTVFTDTGLNTTEYPYTYKLHFYSQGQEIGISDAASSVYLNIAASDQQLALNWDFNTPWVNDSFHVFKRNNSTGLFGYLDSTSQTTFIDDSLMNDSTYCYYVKAFGHYSSQLIVRPLVNLSQMNCATPIDTVAPCPPVLEVKNPCDNFNSVDSFVFSNYLQWHNNFDSCINDIVKYHIYFGADSASLQLIATTYSVDDTTYTHELQTSIEGCYVVTALDKRDNESPKTNTVCVDNCPVYELPNTFTPNGDGANDLFTPRKPYRFVSRVDFKVFNRWGEKVFETTDPELKWNGKDFNGKDLPSGVYFYSGYYYEQRLSGEIKRPLPSKKGGGFIELLR